jgi:hypothetical protein
MDIGAAGSLIIFFSLMVAQILVGGLFLTYAAYSFLHVLVSTSAGNDEVVWPGDPLFDWLFKGWYLGWILVLSVLPGLLIISFARIPPRSPAWVIALAGSLCCLFPIFLLSSLSGASRMYVLRGQILSGMGKRFGLVLIFYFSSALVVVGSITFVWYSMVYGDLLLVPVAMTSLAIAIVFYARLLGRLGHAITEEPARKQSGKSGRPRGESDKKISDRWGKPDTPLTGDLVLRPRTGEKKSGGRKKRTKKSKAVDPWAVPDLEPLARPQRAVIPSNHHDDDPLGPAVGGYDVQSVGNDETSAKQPLPAGAMGEPSDGYELTRADLPPELQRAPALAEVSKYELALASPKQRPDLPTNPMMSGVFTFPFYPTSIGPTGTIALGLVLMGLIARAQMALFPS